MPEKHISSDFLIFGTYDEYKYVMIKAVMTKIGKKVKKKLKRLKLEFIYDLTVGTNVPMYDFDNTCILINKEEVIKNKKNKLIHVYPLCDCYPKKLEFKLCEVLKKQRHLHWLIRLCYHEYDIITRYSDKSFPPKRGFVGLGALLVKWG